MRALRLVLLTSFLAPGLWSGQVTGSWTAEIPGLRGRITALRMELKEDDGAVSGTIRDSHGEETISNGKIDGDQITFTVVSEFHGDQIQQRYCGTVEGDLIHFHVTAQGGEKADGPVRDFEAERTSADAPSDTEGQ